MADNSAVPQTSAHRSAVPDTSETEMWVAELTFMLDCEQRSRAAQFAIRTAVRAVALSERAGTDPIDELLDARALAASDKSRAVYHAAIGYLRADQILGRLR